MMQQNSSTLLSKKSQKRQLNIGCEVLLTILFLYILLTFASRVMEDPSSRKRTEEYFARPDAYDVMFFGNSVMQEAVIPDEIYDKYGIASFNMAHPANLVPTSYWCMRNCFDYSKPKLVVFDGYLSSKPYKISDNNYEYTVHGTFDCFPFSATKVAAALDLYNDKAIDDLQKSGEFDASESRNPLDMLFNYSVYHSKWPEFNMSFFTPGRADFPYGYSSSTSVDDPTIYKEISNSLVDNADLTGFEYIEKAIDTCKDNNIEILLIYLPFQAKEDAQRESNTIANIAKQKGVNFIDFLDADIIDLETDMSDPTHLNPSGAQKVSDYLGKYITEHYDIPIRDKNAEENLHWVKNREWYISTRANELASCESLNEYLMLLSCPQFIVEFYPSDDLIINSDIANLLDDIGIESAKAKNHTKITISGAGSHVEYSYAESASSKSRFIVSDAKTGQIINEREF